MIIRQLDIDRDFESIRSWYAARRSVMPHESAFPKLGYIVPGVAAGFLIKTDTNWGILEPFIANPEKSKEERDSALTLIMETLCEAAAGLGFTSVFGFSTHIAMVERAVSLGFTVIEHDSLTVWKDLT